MLIFLQGMAVELALVVKMFVRVYSLAVVVAFVAFLVEPQVVFMVNIYCSTHDLQHQLFTRNVNAVRNETRDQAGTSVDCLGGF